jgi:hypothetical protein
MIHLAGSPISLAMKKIPSSTMPIFGTLINDEGHPATKTWRIYVHAIEAFPGVTLWQKF